MASFFIHFMMGAILNLVMFILKIIPSTRDVAVIIDYILKIVPSYSFSSGLINLGSRKLFAILDQKDDPYPPFAWNICLSSIVFLSASAFLCFVALFFLEEKSSDIGSVM